MKKFDEKWTTDVTSNGVAINRRRFLRGAGGVAIALPFLEGLPERSAWALSAPPPVFSLYIVAACGVVGKKFFPDAFGALTTAGLAGATGKATAALSAHAPQLLFVQNINFPMNSPTNCGHAQGLCQALTAVAAQGGGKTATSGGISADMVVAKVVNPGEGDPLTLYAGNKRNGYIAERISFKGAGSGQVRSADDNPYTLYSKIVGLTSMTTGAGGSGGGMGGAGGSAMANELITTRKSVNDCVRADLMSLMSNSALSAADKLRVQQHLASIRDAEVIMGNLGMACSKTGLNTSAYDALKSGWAFNMNNGMIEDVARMHMELTALAFACNYNRVATLQWGDGTDHTMYDVPSNKGLGWNFHYLSHRTQSDGTSGTNPTAEAAHAEIDELRMKTLAKGLDAFAARGLQDKTIVLWTNHVADGPSHSFKNVPHIIWGNGGGYLKQGLHVDAGKVTNNKLFNTLIYAAVRDKNKAAVTFGQGTGTGEIAEIKK